MGEPEAETALRRWPDVDVSVFGGTGSQDTPIEQILRAYGEGSGDTGRGTFKVGKRKFLSVNVLRPLSLPANDSANISPPRTNRVLGERTLPSRNDERPDVRIPSLEAIREDQRTV
jgi:hypothetical protein